MNENVMFVVVEKDTNMFINAEQRMLQPDMDFRCLFPTQETAKDFRRRSLGDSQGRHFNILEIEVVEFLNNQLTVACASDDGEEVAPF